jgi:thiopurine S-methyltransferase
MEASFWHERWATNQIGWHERDFNPLLVAHFHRLALPAGSRVFVPLCGKTRDIAWLLQQGYKVAGSELSETAIQQLFAELGVPPTVTTIGTQKRYSAPDLDVFAGDIFELHADQLGPIAATYDRASLVALTPEMRDRYARHLLAMTAGAPQLLICFEYDQNVMAGPPHSVPATEVWRHYGAAYRLTLASAHTVPEGIRGTPASELAWLLQRTTSPR